MRGSRTGSGLAVRTFLRGAVGAVAALVASAAPADARPPNVILLVADDLGAHDLGCDGRADHHTPVLDRWAAEGVRFRAAFSAASVCSPSRVALLAGIHPARANLTTFLPGRSDRASHKLIAPTIAPGLPATVPTLAERLAPAGYRSHFVGKWHLGGAGNLPTDRGFATHAVGRANPGPDSPEGPKGETRQAEEAAAVIERETRERPGEPFLLVVGFDSPHVPLAAPEPMLARHAAAFHPAYAAMLESLDAAVGRILRAVDETAVADETVVVFTSDNGGLHVPEVGDPPPTFNAPYRAGKGFLYDGGLRVPLLLRIPGVRGGPAVVDEPVSTGDLVPTICRWAGVPAPAEGDFRELPGVFAAADAAPAEREFFWHQPHTTNQGGRPSGAIRRGRWKLVEQFEDGSLELYDLDGDRGETADISPREPALVAELRGRLEAWRRDVAARPTTANPGYDPVRYRACHADVDVSRVVAAPTAAETAEGLRAWRAAMDDATVLPPRGAMLRLAASEARIEGKTLRYEPQPEKDTLGFWVEAADAASWPLRLDEPGRYRVTVLQGCGAGQGGSRVAIEAAGSRVEFVVEETGHFQRFVPRGVGILDLPAGPSTLRVAPVEKRAAAVMDLRHVTLERVD